MALTANLGLIVGEKYQFKKKIAEGSYGICFEGLNIISKTKVAIKIEGNTRLNKSRDSSLVSEFEKYKYYLGRISGIPRLYWFGKNRNLGYIMVIDLLGPNLENLFDLCSRKFSLKTNLMLCIQILERLESIHSKGLIHRDLKPENFLIGTDTNSHQIFVIDFGLSKSLIDIETENHIKFATNIGITGTPRYCSINANKGYEQSRRDDLESLAFMLSYFNNGRLPWQGLKIKNGDKHQAILEKKESTPIEQLYEGMDNIFPAFLTYCRNLKFDERPDYSRWKKQFRDLFDRKGYNWDYEYDWIVLLSNRPSVLH
jgi:serine/threonine protein kinase